MPHENITYAMEHGVATITLNRPNKMNAIDAPMVRELIGAIDTARDSDEVRTVVVTGAGRAFCAGADLASSASGADPKLPWVTRPMRLEPLVGLGALAKRLHAFHKPLIAAVNGVAVGAGLAIACLCDLRVASRQAGFGAVFVRRGIVADTGTTFLLPRIVGVEKALELMWTGEIIDADEAQRLGLVSKVVAHEELMPAAMGLAMRIAQGPSTAVELIKRVVYEGLEANNFALQLSYEAWAQSVCVQTDDFNEGVKAFLDKREPTFIGR
ncbi:MAG: 2-(1,2-epoxy-1,2-dihydrophenyl)acetyl-CoA isomerase [Chloroflexota bacterium]|nr:MAG: 2-(1,2-epoxy-1,2-dihydrophenyl)acetyl-CoA isomerase [Chloroflexota bacterium]